jgi:hypothetical protein
VKSWLKLSAAKKSLDAIHLDIDYKDGTLLSPVTRSISQSEKNGSVASSWDLIHFDH